MYCSILVRKCVLQEAVETMVASSAMAVLKEEESKEEAQSPQSSWSKWKRGGIIGAAALTGGTLMAITGGMIFAILNPYLLQLAESSLSEL